MKLIATQPIIKDGVEYPYLTVNLAMSPVYGRLEGASTSLRFTPFRVTEDGNIESLEISQTSAEYDIFQSSDEHLVALGQDLITALQKYVDNKGL